MRIPVPTAFNIEIVGRDDGLHVLVEGELDVATAPLLGDALRQAEAADPARLVVDLTGVTFIDSTGLRALLEAHAREQDHPGPDRLRITGGSEQARKLFRLAGVLDRLPFAASSGE
jgi:anti-anti-sigma factor